VVVKIAGASGVAGASRSARRWPAATGAAAMATATAMMISAASGERTLL
jgi:hypothetical protein